MILRSVLKSFFVLCFTIKVFTNVKANVCVSVPRSCAVLLNVSNNTNTTGDDRTLEIINSTIKAVEELTTNYECISAMRYSMCLFAVKSCNNTHLNSTTLNHKEQQQCMAINSSCTEVVEKVYGSMFCSQINGFSDVATCVTLNVSANAYCPNNMTLKIAAANITEFLHKSISAKEKLEANSIGNMAVECLDKNKELQCAGFVPSCSEQNVTREACENTLSCSLSNSLFNKTEICNKFQPAPLSAMPIFESSSSQKLTIPYNLISEFNATVTLRLNLNETFNTNYTVKTSSDYIELAKNVRESLKVAYRELPGFHDVIIEDLACKREVVAKHVVLSREKNNANVIEAYLILSNLTNGFLKGKVVDVNKVCLASTSSRRVVDENNYVYMIVFVCVTALLLLAMVLCHRSK